MSAACLIFWQHPLTRLGQGFPLLQVLFVKNGIYKKSLATLSSVPVYKGSVVWYLLVLHSYIVVLDTDIVVRSLPVQSVSYSHKGYG